MDGLGFKPHDHGLCRRDGVAAVERACAAAGLRLTPVRRQAMMILLKEHRALGAYEVLDRLREAGFGGQPPVAYRALDFLVANGFAHKIERLNAFVACAVPGHDHAPAFLICRGCDAVAETPGGAAADALSHAARDTGFLIEEAVMEAEGLCPRCAEGGGV